MPISVNDTVTIGLGVMADGLQAAIGPMVPGFMTAVLWISALGGVIVRLLPNSVYQKSIAIMAIFDVGTFWIILRFIGAIFAVMTLWSIGPEVVWSDLTGVVVLYDLVSVLMVWFLFASLFMPLLLEFGLMDFIGAMVRKVMNPLFQLPGRSSVDAMASWMGSGTVGVLLTTQQYEQGYYTKKEASIIATNFSIASIAFSLVIARFLSI